jgi:putative addiction module component (TIGR02574 family)
MDISHPEIASLSTTEKLHLVEALWDDIAQSPESVPIHAWQVEELDRRRDKFIAAPESGRPWSEVVQRIRNGQ